MSNIIIIIREMNPSSCTLHHLYTCWQKYRYSVPWWQGPKQLL